MLSIVAYRPISALLTINNISLNWEKPRSEVTGCVRARMSFAILRATLTHLCIKGRMVLDDGAGLPTPILHIQVFWLHEDTTSTKPSFRLFVIAHAVTISVHPSDIIHTSSLLEKFHSQKALSNMLDNHLFNVLLGSLAIADRASLLSASSPHATSRLMVIPSERHAWFALRPPRYSRQH